MNINSSIELPGVPQKPIDPYPNTGGGTTDSGKVVTPNVAEYSDRPAVQQQETEEKKSILPYLVLGIAVIAILKS